MSEDNHFYTTPIFSEGNGCKNTRKKITQASQTAWNKLLKPAVIVAAPFIGMAVGAKTKNPKNAQATTNILKSISGGKILSLTNIHGFGLRIKVMYIISKIVF